MKFKIAMLLLIGFLFATVAAPAHSPPKQKTENVYQTSQATVNQMSQVMVQSTAASFDAPIQAKGSESATIAAATPAEKEVSVKPKDRQMFSQIILYNKITGCQKISLYSEKFNRLKNSKWHSGKDLKTPLISNNQRGFILNKKFVILPHD